MLSLLLAAPALAGPPNDDASAVVASAEPTTHARSNAVESRNFAQELSYSGAGPNTVVAGTVHVPAASGQAWVELPGLAQVRARDGKIEASLRRGNRWERWEGMAPADLPFDAVIPGRRGALCATGSVSVAAPSDRGAFTGFIDVDTAPSTTAPGRISGGPAFGPPGCD